MSVKSERKARLREQHWQPVVDFICLRDTAYMELFKACLLIAWGIALVNPATDSFRVFRTFTHLSIFDAQLETVWGIFAIVIGGAQSAAVIYNTIMMRFVLSAINLIFWILCLVVFQAIVPFTLAPIIAFVIVLFSIVITLRSWGRFAAAQRAGSGVDG